MIPQNKEVEELATSFLEGENKKLIEKIQDISNQLIAIEDSLDTRTYYTYNDQLTGMYGVLNPAYRRLRALKENYEARYFNYLKQQADVNNDKFVATTAAQQASEYIAPLRLARDVLEGYVEVCTKAIDTCRIRIYESKKDGKYDV